METIIRVVEVDKKDPYTGQPGRAGQIEMRIRNTWVKRAGDYATREEAAQAAGKQFADMLLRFEAVRFQPLEVVE